MNKDMSIQFDSIVLPGMLNIPEQTKGLVIFAHGTGSSRLSPRNIFVADYLNRRNIGTLLFDLLTEEEDRVYQSRFDIDLISERLVKTTQWVLKNDQFRDLNLGYFGASTGSAAAFNAAVCLPEEIKAIVSRGGRPDLVINNLSEVKAPSLLIVGGLDDVVLELNYQAYENIRTAKKLVVIPGATHLFEEPGALESVSLEAGDWFEEYLIK
jgi:dienelactone hydrolase